MLPKEIFRQYDIRGTVPDTFNADIAKSIANAFAHQAISKSGKKSPTISVGRDVRLSGEEIFQGVKQGLMDAGCTVVGLGVCPTPVTYFSAFHLETDAFIMITGSHNPPEYNGMKLGIGRGTYHGDDILSLAEDFERYGYRKGSVDGTFSEYDINKAYIDWNIEHFSRLSKMIRKMKRRPKVIIDSGNGVASNVAPAIFEALGVDVVELFCEEDGTFPNHHPDPTVEENLEDAKESVRKNRADFAVAYDGDADRIGVVAENGMVIWGDILLTVYARELKKQYETPTIIADVKASQVLFDYLEKIGVRGIMWKTGHSLIKNKLKEQGAELAGEMSGHIFFKDRYFGYDDAIYSSLRFLEAYVINIRENRIGKASDFTKDLPTVYNTPEIRFDTPEETKFEIVDRLKERFNELKAEGNGIRDIIDIDGIRVVFENGWGLLRASNTQPVLVMRFEATDEASMNEYRAMFERELNALT